MAYFAELRQLLIDYFDLKELKSLAFELDIKPDEIAGSTRTEYAENLITYCHRQLRLTELVSFCRKLRPRVEWPEPPADMPAFADYSGVLDGYLEWVAERYSTMQTLHIQKPLADIYTDVYLLDKNQYWKQQDVELREQEFTRKRDLGRDRRRDGVSLLTETNRLFVVGRPGAGKTTFCQWLALQAARRQLPVAKIPIYLPLRQFNQEGKELWDLLTNQLWLGGFPRDGHHLETLVRSEQALLLLDGLDEVQAARREALNYQIDELGGMPGGSHIIITCRPHAEKRRFNDFDYVHVAGFEPEQSDEFIRNWFKSDADKANEIIQKLKKNESIRELAQTPLLAALLCIAVGETGSFPERRDLLYKRALDVILEKWDDDRGVKRDSAYGELKRERKEALLAYVAYHTFERELIFIDEQSLHQEINNFWQDWLQERVDRQLIRYQGQLRSELLPDEEVDADQVVREIATQHGLLVEQAEGVYSFSHLTLQEYFAAKYIVDNEARGTLPRLMAHLGNDRWREIFLLTAGMLDEATEFCRLYLAALAKMAAQDETVLALLQWGAGKSAQSRGSVKPPALRAFTFTILLARARDLDRALALARAHARDFAHDLALARAHARDLAHARDRDRALARALDRARALARALAPVLAPALALTHDLALALARDLDLAHARDLARDLDRARARARTLDLALDLAVTYDLAMLRDLPGETTAIIAHVVAWRWPSELAELQASLQALSVSKDDASLATWGAFNEELETIILAHWGLKQFWEFSSEQAALLTTYLEANHLLLACLQLAYVPDREAIENQMLLPPGWPDE